jgi:type IV fimbrial biogenesis protein FimT
MLETVQPAKLGFAPSFGRHGASTFELMAAIALVAILTGAAVPSLRQSASGVQLRSASVQLAAALLRARTAAMIEGRTWSVVAETSSYTVGPLGERGEREKLPAGVQFVAANSGGDVRFSPSGTAENATLTLGVASLTRDVVVNQRGKVVYE